MYIGKAYTSICVPYCFLYLYIYYAYIYYVPNYIYTVYNYELVHSHS